MESELTNAQTPLLRLRNIKKTFPNGTIALSGVNLDVTPGKVHGLLGANGAGKSTLINILAGAYQASGGVIEWKGQPAQIAGPRNATELGIATIHQHIPLVPTLSVLENIFLSDIGLWRKRRDYRTRYADLCERVDYHINPDAIVSDLPIGQRQMVAILTALVSGADLIVMDEPTASLATEERDLVYRVVRRLSQLEGKAVLFVSHFLDEVVDLTDCVTVLRDGRVAFEATTDTLDEAKIAEAIVGREVIALEREARIRPSFVLSHKVEKPRLELRNLASFGKFAPLSLSLAPGEVLGIAGLLGSGRSEIVHAIFRADTAATGDVLVEGKVIGKSTAAAVRAGMALVPEDRMRQGLVPGFEIWRNTTLPALKLVSRFGLMLMPEREVQRGQEAIDRLNIKAESPDVLVTELSGGNAQKTTIGKWLFSDAKVFLLDEPTAGIDIGAKTDILKLVRKLAETGMSVIIVSSDFEELLTVSDRIMVLRDGRQTAMINACETNEHELVLLSGGEQPKHTQDTK